jgi:hypothetical protein
MISFQIHTKKLNVLMKTSIALHLKQTNMFQLNGSKEIYYALLSLYLELKQSCLKHIEVITSLLLQRHKLPYPFLLFMQIHKYRSQTTTSPYFTCKQENQKLALRRQYLDEKMSFSNQYKSKVTLNDRHLGSISYKNKIQQN